MFKKLNILSKLTIVGIAFCLPIITLLYLLVAEKNIAINFGQKELYGDIYLRPLRQLLEHIPQHKLVAARNIRTNSSLKLEMINQQEQIDKDFNELIKVDQELGSVLGTTEKLNSLKNNWQSLKTSVIGLNARENEQMHNRLAEEIRSLISHAGDTSNLILDPDLDTYYLMDTTLLKLTERADHLYKLMAIIENTLNKKVLSADDKTQIVVLTGLINSNVDANKTGLNVSFKTTANKDLQTELEPVLNEDQSTAKAFLSMINNRILNAPKINISTNDFIIEGNKAVNSAFKLWDKSIMLEDRLIQERIDRFKNNKFTTITLALIFTGLILLLGTYLAMNIVNAIRKLDNGARKVAGGDLDIQVDITTGDELESLSNSFNIMIENIKHVNTKLQAEKESVEIKASETEEARMVLQEQMDKMILLTSEAKMAKEESEKNSLNLETLIKETSTSVSQIKQTSELVSDNARIVAEAANLSVNISNEGQRAVADSIEGVDKIKAQIEAIAEKILELSAQTQAIGKIISTVDDIAKQSKLLAFNAAIEASKAGEFGKGFTVVSTEIKNLSEESKEATNKISEILGEIQQLTNMAVMMTEDGTKLADSGVILSNVAGETINKLALSIQNSSEAAMQISTSAQEQKIGMEQLEESMKSISFIGIN